MLEVGTRTTYTYDLDGRRWRGPGLPTDHACAVFPSRAVWTSNRFHQATTLIRAKNILYDRGLLIALRVLLLPRPEAEGRLSEFPNHPRRARFRFHASSFIFSRLVNGGAGRLIVALLRFHKLSFTTCIPTHPDAEDVQRCPGFIMVECMYPSPCMPLFPLLEFNAAVIP
ncbi:hypothetical protein CYLTODRAFT_277616 [Cylindrobasidium torrendii FP15055 ss-10]|uniref:Uncharacterized protein n=1 Tax=Cylindrobasidium torrendii FP15055 ss-10 TaxID=1314674 RepID=A0A0D7BBI8_9AGAR|nr:hypothetical protein CYLTODRAFT_277616 [Cylindrobasidium torrendii FP15055 ss-10]